MSLNVSFGHAGAAVRLVAATVAMAGVLAAQQIPASITTIDQPTAGHAVWDAVGNVYYLSGPVTAGAAQTLSGGGTCYLATGFIGSVPEVCSDAIVAKVDPSGKVVFGTLLGGSTADTGSALAVNSGGDVFVTGSTGGQFPTTPGAALTNSTTARVFAARISADGSKFVYSTYLPDMAATSAAIALDSNDNAYIAGRTVTGHAYVIKLSSDGTNILYTATLAGSNVDAATAIVIDGAGNALVAGETTSADFPVTGSAVQKHLAGVENNFIARLDAAGHVSLSTYLGGSGADTPSAIGLDGGGNIYLAGSTSSLDFPTTPGTMQSTPIVPAWNNSSPAGFVAKLTPEGAMLDWGTYVMSSDIGIQVGVGEMAVTAGGDVFVGGITGPGFPVTASAPQVCFLGQATRADGFVAHLNSQGALVDATYLGPAKNITAPLTSNGTDVNFVWGLKPTSTNSLLVVWHYAGNNVLSTVQFGSGGWTAPACLSADALNAATQTGGIGIAPGELVTLMGFGIGPDVGVAYTLDAQGMIPTELAGVQVTINHEKAPVLYAQSRQINVAAPTDLTIGGSVDFEMTYNGQHFGPFAAPVAFGSPGIFRLHIGESAQAVAMNEDWTLNGPSNPAARGEVVTVWATGLGNTDPPCVAGGLNDPQAEPLSPGISVLLFGGDLTKAMYAGSSPTLVCGVTQINFRVPDTVPIRTYFFSPWVQWSSANSTTTYQPPVGATIAVK